jgi:hypothetical protein
MASTNEEEKDILCNENDNNAWEVVRGAKRRKTRKLQQINNDNHIEVSNVYELLPAEPNDGPTAEDANIRQPPKPPPIFIHGVVNYTEMIKRIKKWLRMHSTILKVSQMASLK